MELDWLNALRSAAIAGASLFWKATLSTNILQIGGAVLAANPLCELMLLVTAVSPMPRRTESGFWVNIDGFSFSSSSIKSLILCKFLGIN